PPDYRRSPDRGLLPPLPSKEHVAVDAVFRLFDLQRPSVGDFARERARGRGSGDTVMGTQARLVEVRQNVLRQNDILARGLRQRFRDAGVYVVSLVSSPGSGKTAFLEKTLTLLLPCH